MTEQASKSVRDAVSVRALGLIFLVSLALVAPFVANGFVSDDWDLIQDVATGGPFAIWTVRPSIFFRPLVSASLWLNHLVGGWHSWAYFGPNFILHAACSCLVFTICGSLIGRLNAGPPLRASVSALAALVFMSTPSHAEALFFMSCRTDLQAAFFGLLAIHLLLAALDKGRYWLASGAVVSLALGCLSKESVYLLFGFFIAAALLEPKATGRARIGWLASSLSVVATSIVVILRLRVVAGGLPYGADVETSNGMLKGFLRVVELLVRPNVPIDPGVVLTRSLPHLSACNVAALVLIVLIIAYATYRLLETPTGEGQAAPKRGQWVLPIVGFALSAGPVCGFATPLASPESGRLMYLPSAFSAIIFAYLVARWLPRAASRRILTGFMALASAFLFLEGVFYDEAGTACQSTVDWFKANRPGQRVAVFLVPDSVDGRYIWRNGLPGALEMFAPEWARAPHVIVPYLVAAQLPKKPPSAISLEAIEKGPVVRFALGTSGSRLTADLVVVRPAGKVDLYRSVTVDQKR